MNDAFTQKLFELANTSPELQQTILKGISETGYSIPTGDITLAVFSREETPEREKLIQAIQRARELRVKDLARILGELRVYLITKEVQGETLQPEEKTLRDIDINALAVYALVEWLAHVQHTEGSGSSDN